MLLVFPLNIVYPHCGEYNAIVHCNLTTLFSLHSKRDDLE